jgi:regulator of protease activity HflC (stomatin/prohibitin superfamily)
MLSNTLEARQRQMEALGFRRLITGGIVAIGAIWLAYGSWFIVSPGYMGVITRAGSIAENIYEEGFHLKLPLIDSAHEVNVQTLTFQGKGIDAATKDLQSVTAEMAVIFSVDKVDVKDVYRNYRTVEMLQSRALQPVIEEAFKAAASGHTAEELITQRAVIRDKLLTSMREKLQPHYVTVKDVNITNFAFSKGFADAVEGKVKAEQQAKKAEYDLARIRTEGEQRVATATAEAAAIKAQAEAINKQGGAEYVQLKWIEKWNGALPTTQMSGGGATSLIQLPAK